MSRKIKFHAFHFLFSLFAYLADKSGGWRVFVRPKLLLGSLIIGLGLTSCNARIDKTKDSGELISKKQNINIQNKDSTKNKTIKQTKNQPNIHFSKPIVMSCYDVVEIKNDTSEVDSNTIYQVVNQMPQFPKGSDSLSTYVSKNLKWPNTDADVQGKVILRFVVNTDGSISDIEVIRSLDPLFDAEAIRVIKTLPNFIPGKQNGQVVRAYYTLPIIFRLQY